MKSKEVFRKELFTDAVFVIKQTLEKHRETHLAFIDFEKVFDQVNRVKLWTVVRKKGYPNHLVCSEKCIQG